MIVNKEINVFMTSKHFSSVFLVPLIPPKPEQQNTLQQPHSVLGFLHKSLMYIGMMQAAV
jgi:hypothetical protein